jgi:ABC-2 type transport system permease protein
MPRSKLLWQCRAALAVAEKDMRIYYLKPPVLIFGVFFPVCLFLAFAFGRNIPMPVLLPGMLGMTLFFLSSSTSPLVAPWETLSRTLERLVSTPASIAAIVSGDIFAGAVYGIAISFFLLAVSIVTMGISPVHPALLGLNICLSAVCFSALGSLIATLPTDSPGNIMLVLNVIRLPLIFVSGVFMPLARMPAWGRKIAAFSPLTYTCDLARHGLLGTGYFPMPLSLGMLAAFTAGFCAISIVLHKKSTPRRLA